SGGTQEEASVFGEAVLVLRDPTERPEGIAAGAAKLVGTSSPALVEEAERVLHERGARRRWRAAPGRTAGGGGVERRALVVEGALVAGEPRPAGRPPTASDLARDP